MFNLTRNNYDKVGHFAQGFVPVLITREIVLRKNIINSAIAALLSLSRLHGQQMVKLNIEK